MPGTASCSRASGRINIKNARYAEDQRPLDPAARATRAALFAAPICGIFFSPEKSRAATLNTLHNLNFYLDTMRTD